MFRFDVRTSVLAGFVARKENHATRLFRVPVKHESAVGDWALALPVLNSWSWSPQVYGRGNELAIEDEPNDRFRFLGMEEAPLRHNLL